jgi:CBS domain containing-hemolysin-like protein
VRLEELSEPLGYTFDHPKVTTVSGLVLTLLGRPAAVGDVVTYKNTRVEVAAVAGRGVQDAVITAGRIEPAGTDRPGPPAGSSA